MKVRPPPGFGATKQTDVVVFSRGKFGSCGNAHSGIGEFELIKDGYMNRQNTGTETENRFLELLISNKVSSSSLQQFSQAEGWSSYHAYIMVI